MTATEKTWGSWEELLSHLHEKKKNYNSGMSKFLLRLKAILSIKNNKLYLLFLLPLLPIIK